MLSKINQDLDEDSALKSSFADITSELMITEDNRSAIGASYRFNMASFEASKKLLNDTKVKLEIDIEAAPERNTLLRRLEIFEE